MDDTRLIVEVEKLKVIYDPQYVMYKDVQVKERAWEAVADAVGVDVSECKRRWKLLRDAFVRNQKKKPSGSAGGTIREWKYSRVMSFLLPYMQPRSSRHTLHGDEQPLDMSAETCDFDAEVSEFNRPYSPMTVTQRSVTPSQTTHGPDTSIPPTTSRPHTPTPTLHPRVQQLMTEGQPPRQRRRNISPSSTEQHLLDIITQPTTPAPPQIPKQEEETYYFALSLVPKLNRLLPRNRNRAEIQILTYLAELDLEDENKRQHGTPTNTVFPSSQLPQGAAFQPYHPTPTYHQRHSSQNPRHVTENPTTSSLSEQHSASLYHQL